MKNEYFKNIFMENDNIFSKEVFKSLRISGDLLKDDRLTLEKMLEEDDINNDHFLTNQHGHRSETFINHHDGKHILFAGCSETVGEGLSLAETWSFKLFNKIKKNYDLSGYFNISNGKTGFATIIPNIFKYCNSYGNPDAIFINFPNILRFYSFEEGNYTIDNLIEQNMENAGDQEAIRRNSAKFYLLLYHYYFMLEQFCESNNIKLFAFTWDIWERPSKSVLPTQEVFDMLSFKTFFGINKDNLAKYIDSYILKNSKEKDIAIFSRDKSHSGTAINDFWANFMFEKFLENKI
jgi:hypothetical protein